LGHAAPLREAVVEKPVLYTGCRRKLQFFGVSEAAARLPSALSHCCNAVACVLAWGSMAKERRDGLLLLPTSVGMIGFSHAAATDMPSAACSLSQWSAPLSSSALCVMKHSVLPRRPWLGLILFEFSWPSRFLQKARSDYSLRRAVFSGIDDERWRDAFRLLHSRHDRFVLRPLPSLVVLPRAAIRLLRVFIIEHNFKALTTPEFQHIQPFWYYLPVLSDCAATLVSPSRSEHLLVGR